MIPVMTQTLRDLFTPIPETPASRDLTVLGRVSRYTDTARGISDFYEGIKLCLEYARLVPHLKPSSYRWMAQAQQIADLSSSALSVPSFLSDVHNVRKALRAHQDAVAGTPSPLRNRQILQAKKQCCVSVAQAFATIADCFEFLHAAELVQNVVRLPVIQCVSAVGYAIVDGASLGDEIFKSENHTDKSLWMRKVAQHATSVALSCMTIIGIGCAATSPITVHVVALLVLGLSTVHFVMKVSVYFSEQQLKEASLLV